MIEKVGAAQEMGAAHTTITGSPRHYYSRRKWEDERPALDVLVSDHRRGGRAAMRWVDWPSVILFYRLGARRKVAESRLPARRHLGPSSTNSAAQRGSSGFWCPFLKRVAAKSTPALRCQPAVVPTLERLEALIDEFSTEASDIGGWLGDFYSDFIAAHEADPEAADPCRAYLLDLRAASAEAVKTAGSFAALMEK